MRDADLTYQHEVPVVAVLQDGRQLDGVLRRFEHHYEVAGSVFEPWMADEILEDRGGLGPGARELQDPELSHGGGRAVRRWCAALAA